MSYSAIISLLLSMNMQQQDVSEIPCTNCHSPDGWDKLPSVMIFDHNETNFPLVGSHTVLNCRPCHAGDTVEEKHDFKTADSECASCHLDIHKTSMGKDCVVCHNTEAWLVTRRTFDHETTTFSLNGAHRLPLCQDCHQTTPEIQFNFTPTDCCACHRSDYDNTVNPNHITVNLRTDCEQCHSISQPDWEGSFDHNLTQFPLLGLHKPLSCDQCHTVQSFSLSIECSSCHLNEFQSAQNPDHNLAGYPLESCNACHSEFGWIPHQFNHDLPQDCSTCHMIDYTNAVNPLHSSELGFNSDCERCHTSTSTWSGALFDHSGVSTNCVSCHLADYENASDPPHSEEMGFSQTCETCHNGTTTWDDATFSHESITTDCNTCHMNDFYEEHNDGFPTNCEACHTTNDWDDVTFDHDNNYFPINSGDHKGEWSTCEAECHVNPSDYTVFSCGLNGVCHDHDQSDMDDEHQDESNYTYDSAACYNCHPNGKKEDNDDIFNPGNWRNELKIIRNWKHN